MHTKTNNTIGSTPKHKEGAKQAPSPVPTTSSAAAPSNSKLAVTPAPKLPTKRALVLTLLTREDGATLTELSTATGWQPHSIRAVLTGLRKSGLVLEKSIRDGAICYQILGASDARG